MAPKTCLICLHIDGQVSRQSISLGISGHCEKRKAPSRTCFLIQPVLYPTTAYHNWPKNIILAKYKLSASDVATRFVLYFVFT